MRAPDVGWPLLRRELVGLLRTRRAFWLLVVVFSLSSLLPLLAWPQPEQGGLQFMQVLATTMTFFGAQLTAALLAIPAFTAGAISGERERETYDLLYTTLLSPFSIVFAKALASAGYVLLLLSACAPIAFLLHLLGGVEASTVLKCYGITFASVVTSGLVCLAHSMRSRRTSQAAVRGITWMLVWNGGLVILLSLMVGLLIALTDRALQRQAPGIFYFLASLTPYSAIYAELFTAEMRSAVAMMGVLGFSPWVVYLVYAAVLSLLHLVYLLRRVRTPELAKAPSIRYQLLSSLVLPEHRETLAALAKVRVLRRPLFGRLLLGLGEGGWPLLGNAVFMKEVRAEFFGRLWYRRVAFWIPLLISGVLAALSIATHEITFLAYGSLTLTLTLVLLLAPAVASSSVTREAEEGNLDLLRGTLLSPWAVLRGKLLAGLYSVWGMVAAGLWALVLGGFVVLSAIRPEERDREVLGRSLAVMAVVPPLAVLFSSALGLLTSVLCRRTLAALLTSSVVIIVLFLLVPIVAGLLSLGGEDPLAIFLASTNPYWTLGRVTGWRKDTFALARHAGFLLAAGSVLFLTAGLCFSRTRMRDP